MVFAAPVALGGKGVIWQDDFSADLGWTGYAPSAWERGAAAVSSGCTCGTDPAFDHSGTSDNMLLGYAIGGCYANSMTATSITSPVIDCSGQEGVWLSFWRVLGVENNYWDQASVEVYDGSSWVEIWHNGSSSMYETDWSLQEYDVAAYANYNANFQVRFTLGPSDSSVNGCGWNIDDLQVFTLDDYCVSANPLSSMAAAGEGFAATHSITLTNCGVSDIDVDLTVMGNTWLTEITDAQGNPISMISLLYGESAVVMVHVTVGAGNNDACTFNATIQIPEKETTVDVELVTQKLLNYNDFSTDPAADGWTGFTAGEWEWGPATASTGCSGTQDPDADHSGTTDNNLIGYAIGGCYPNSMPATLWLTSPPYDFSTMVGVTLDFWRMLGVENAYYDHAIVEATNDGTNWVTIWQNVDSMSDTAWTNVTHDLSTVADGHDAVHIRFGMGPSDSSVTYAGWSIDDLGFRGYPAGYVEGIVSDTMGPIEGALIEVEGTGYTVLTDDTGYYHMALPAGTHDMTASAMGHNPLTVTGVVITEGQTTTQNFTLTAGYVQGIVSDNMGPIEGALVEVDGTEYSDMTDATGHYEMTLPVGTYDMTASAAGHIPEAVTGVVITNGQTTTQNFILTYPDINVDPMELTVEVDWGQIETRTITVTNTGNGPLDWTAMATANADKAAAPTFEPMSMVSTTALPANAEVSPWLQASPFRFGAENRAQWDVLYTLGLDSVVGSNRQTAADFANGHFWVVGADPIERANFIYEVDTDGTLLNTYPQGTSSTWGMRDMAYDGTYLYAGDELGFYQIDPTNGAVTQLFSGTLGLGCIRALTYYPPNDSFIGTNWGSSGEAFIEFDRAGNTIRSFGSTWAPVARYGMAYDMYTPGGPYLWIFDQQGYPSTFLYQATIETPGSEALTGFTYAIPTLPGASSYAIAGGLFITGGYQTGLAVIGGVVQDEPDVLFVLELAPYATWLTVDPLEGTVPAGGSAELTVTFDSNEVEGFGVYEGSIVISSNDGDENPVTVPCTMIVAGGASLNGTVTDGTDAPIEDAVVTIVDLELTTMTDADGYYEFIQIMPGTGYTVTVEKEGYNPASAMVDLPADEVVTQDFVLTYPDVMIDPMTFEQTQAPNTTDTILDALTMSNAGTGPADWTAAVQYPPGTFNWLSIMPNQGTIDGGASLDLALTFNTAGLMVGDYTAQIRFVVEPSAGTEETITVGVTLHVENIPTPTEIPPTPTMEPTAPPPTATPVEPTNTPVPPTPTPEPTSPPPTPTEGPEPTATEIPGTPTPVCETLGVELTIPFDYISPGDMFWVKANICSPDGAISQAPFFALLDINIGEYWFYPTWVHYPPDVAWEYIDLPQGITTRMVLDEFEWPDTGSDSFNGIYIHAALLNPEMTAIIGDFDSVSFGYGPQR